jgi:hypothetical protein
MTKLAVEAHSVSCLMITSSCFPRVEQQGCGGDLHLLLRLCMCGIIPSLPQELRHQARWTACTSFWQFKMQMRYPLPNRANELLAMSQLRLGAAVGLLTGHTSLRPDLYRFGHSEGQESRLCGCDKEDSVHIVCDCPGLACKRYRIWGSMFLKPKDQEKVRVSSLLSLMANTGLGLVF